MRCSTTSKHTSDFLVAHSTSIKALKAVTGFWNLKHESSPLSVLKNIGDCVGSRGEWFVPFLAPLFFAWTISDMHHWHKPMSFSPLHLHFPLFPFAPPPSHPPICSTPLPLLHAHYKSLWTRHIAHNFSLQRFKKTKICLRTCWSWFYHFPRFFPILIFWICSRKQTRSLLIKFYLKITKAMILFLDFDLYYTVSVSLDISHNCTLRIKWTV